MDIVEAEAALTVATMVDIVVEVMTDTDAPLLHITGAMITDEDPDLDHFLHVSCTENSIRLNAPKFVLYNIIMLHQIIIHSLFKCKFG